MDNEQCNYFYELLEMKDGATGSNVASSVFESLKPIGEENLKKNMIGFGTDGASVMRGQHAGAAVKLQSLTKSNFKAFHCMAHKMELAVNMATTSAGEVARFRMFTDSIYAFYHRSPKNMYELRNVAASLHAQLVTISPVFTVRWVFSSLRAIKAFHIDFAPLYHHLVRASQDRQRPGKDKSKCAGLAKKMKEWTFVAEMLLLYDSLETLWHLSAYLQTRTASLIYVCSNENKRHDQLAVGHED